MLQKRDLKNRSKEEKERILLEVQRLGVVSGCRKFGIDPSIYYYWLKKYNAHGLEGLADQRGKTNEKLLRDAQKQISLLKELLAEKELELRLKDELLKKKMAQWQQGKK
jgi:putative transposase